MPHSQRRIRAACIAMLLVAGAMAAALPTRAMAAVMRPSAPAGQVTIIILDMSGSMSDNDPNGYRCSAANAYIDLSGPGQSIGLIGLDNNNATGPSGGPHNYRQAMRWSDPIEAATINARQNLRNIIQQKSNGCKPDGNTPTYDALNQALTMLGSATQGGKSGSVILLTDGAPDPQGADQVANIKSELVPQFKQKGWPIDAIALGKNASDNGIDYHAFLSDLSNATAGAYYDDSKGPIAGVSPLNLESFFVDIFKLRNGRTPGPTIAPTSLNGGTVQRNFSVGNFVSHLDVIAVKDQPGTTVTATAPNGQTITQTGAGAFVASDPHYVIFSIDGPQSGPWQLNVTGNGQFLMDSLVVSTLSLTITNPTKGKSLPLGQPVTITAQLRDQGNGVVGQFQVKGLIEYKGNGTFTPREVVLTDPNGSGDYTIGITLPIDAPAGSYQITITAHSASEDAVATEVVTQFALFPTAVLISPATQKPTTDPITAHVVQWDGALRFIYSHLPFYSSNLLGWHPSDWPLGGVAADASALVDGEVLVGPIANGNVYGNGTVKATATRSGSSNVIPVTVENDRPGYFRLHFPPNITGTFAVQLTTAGSFRDSFGDLTTTGSSVMVTVGIPSQWDEVRAWLITAFYTLALAIILIFGIYGPVNYTIRAKPSKNNRLIDLAINQRAQSRRQMDPGTPILWHGWSLRRYFAPNRVPASEIALPENLIFVHRRSNEVAVQVRSPRRNDPGAQWTVDGRRLTHSDGTETIVTNMRLAYTEAGQKQEWKFEQDTRGMENGGSAPQGGLRDKMENLAGNLGVRDRLRRARGQRND